MKLSNEPLITAASVVAAVSAVLATMVAFGVDLTAEQTEAILGLAAVIAPLLVAFLAHKKVTPWATTVARVDEAGTPVAGPASDLPEGTPIALTKE